MKKQIPNSALILVAFVGLTVCGRGAIGEVPTHHIEVLAKRFAFEPADITLKKGELR